MRMKGIWLTLKGTWQVVGGYLKEIRQKEVEVASPTLLLYIDCVISGMASVLKDRRCGVRF